MLKDVKQHYYSIEKQYLTMVKMLKEVEEAVKGGFLPVERIEQTRQMTAKLKENYDRSSYWMYLLTRPSPKKSVNRQFNQMNDGVKQYLKDNKATTEDQLLEGSDALKKLRAHVDLMKKEIKEKQEKEKKING